MKVALFAAGGGIPVAALRALHPVAEIAAVIRADPAPTLSRRVRGAVRRLLRGPAAPDELGQLAKSLGIAERRMQGPGDPAIAPWLGSLGIDVSCVATFPWRLGGDVLAAARLGTINVHGSFLPRHRGPNPWFWTYYHDDRDAGVTIHLCDDALDSGDILRQDRWPLARGYPAQSLHHDAALRGAALLAEIVSTPDLGRSLAVPQDPARVTSARRVPPGTLMVDPAWPVERAWHFLAGLAGLRREPLRCDAAAVPYDLVPGYEVAEPDAAAGTVTRVHDNTWRLWCRDGFVTLVSSGP